MPDFKVTLSADEVDMIVISFIRKKFQLTDVAVNRMELEWDDEGNVSLAKKTQIDYERDFD